MKTYYSSRPTESRNVVFAATAQVDDELRVTLEAERDEGIILDALPLLLDALSAASGLKFRISPTNLFER